MWNIEHFDILPTTMDVAHVRGQSGNFHTAIIANEQNAGRGRHGNQWIAPPGNLNCSLVFKPEIEKKDVGQYSFVVSVALADTIKPLLKDGFTYQHKWPNDALINGRKLSGLLLETGSSKEGEDYLVIGLGVNLLHAPPDRISLAEASGKPIEAKSFLNQYLGQFDQNISYIKQYGFSYIREKWLENAKGIGETITVRLPNETFFGIFKGLDSDGALLLGLDNGQTKVIHSGDVYFGKDS